MRILAFDPGMNFGYGGIGGHLGVQSGSRRLRGGASQMGITMRHADQVIRELILSQRPQVLAFASPFIGMRGGRPIQPDAIRPLMGLMAKIEEIAEELKIRCIELSEPECRRAFLNNVPRKSADIKKAVMRACRERGWPCMDDHSADALCVASRALEIIAPDTAHEITPLFATAPAKRRRSKAKP